MRTTTEQTERRLNLAKREALGLRGRFGCDAWQVYQDKLPTADKRAFLVRHGVPADRVELTMMELGVVLREEGIVRAV